MSTNIQGIERPAPRAEKTVVDVPDSAAVQEAYRRAMESDQGVSVIPGGTGRCSPELTEAIGPISATHTPVGRNELRILRGAYRRSAVHHFKEVFRSVYQVARYIAKTANCQIRIWRTPRI